MLPADDDLDEEELQELQQSASPVKQRTKAAIADDESLIQWMCSELWRLARESPQNCAAVLTLLVCSIAVICFAIVRDMRHEWKNCDENTQMAKHF